MAPARARTHPGTVSAAMLAVLVSCSVSALQLSPPLSPRGLPSRAPRQGLRRWATPVVDQAGSGVGHGAGPATGAATADTGRPALPPPVAFVVRYFQYMRQLWRPEEDLPRKVQITRLIRWLNSLDEVLEREKGNSSSVETDITTATSMGIADVREACARLKSTLNLDLESHAEQKRVTARNKSSLAKRLATGWALGAGCAWWIFSGNLGHALGLFLLAAVAQLEYYRSVISTGVYPARRISLVTTFIMYMTACYAPSLHQLVIPLAATAVMTWFLVMRPKPGTISEISSSFMGMFYVGYLPSFWVRLRTISEGLPVTTVAAPGFFAALGLPSDIVTQGAVVKFWTCLTIVGCDVGAYFGGKYRGRTKLSTVGRGAAGSASPNKTVEGVLSGMAVSVVMSLAGAKMMQWPLWPMTGALLGVLLSITALVGDLTASLFKRDAGLKDFGNLFPGHGGVMDRFDSYIPTGPLVYCFMRFFLPLFATT
eukprot:CAMPEP_0118991574 /NCGR_PEP_ID=MMETSP1173-20130426/51849_1 /TAXON_ID=1034831 /ORGANISM="Rhizochromulina marina cf, Strain CCMP1243" /LENGTH=483 /DNA_ID=CAMNT_0006942711 /DNA_START=202 /DNA_END=1649 /DNA_ORIENTATION=-